MILARLTGWMEVSTQCQIIWTSSKDLIMKWKLPLGLAALLFTLIVSATTLPGIIVIGQRSDGGNIVCRGKSCADVLRSLQNPVVDQYQAYASEEDHGVDSFKFCKALRAAKPANCNASSPPPSPALSGNWQPTGCGTGRLSRTFLDFALERAASNSYSGEIDAPSPGVSFLAACNSHDLCYATAGGKDSCDLAFRDNMLSACRAAGNSANCQGWASTYHGAVSTMNAAQSAYKSSSEQRACALWSHDVTENGC